jgi:hypothetical protein
MAELDLTEHRRKVVRLDVKKDWEETVEVLKQYGGVTAPLQAHQLYTNDFVPTGAEFIPPPS